MNPIGHLVLPVLESRTVPSPAMNRDQSFPMIRHMGLLSNRWKHRYLPMARRALKQPAPSSAPKNPGKSWTERHAEYRGRDTLTCPDCNLRMVLVAAFFASWTEIQLNFESANKNPTIPAPLREWGSTPL